tara:strand:+ start:129 stop:734 length:606 start_codon:yes stop_codon:yes gene_type:complete
MKEKILQTAANMFLTYGFKSVTMDEISRELGISKKTIYSHFANKTKLVEAVTLYLFEIISTGIDNIVKQNLNVIEEIYVIRNFVSKHLKDEKSSPIHQLQKYYRKIYHDLHSRRLAIMDQCVVSNLQRGIGTGIYRADINVPIISRLYYMGMTVIKNEEMFPPAEFPLSEVTNHYLDYHLRAISTEKGLEILKKFTNENQN